MVCRRYGGSAFSMLDGFISTGRLCGFIDEFFDMYSEERLWEFWLHKETGRSWEYLRLACIPQDIDVKQLEDAVKEIEDVLSGGE